ncbi:DUF6730 family protein [Zunongwangia sp. HGR-M22]|uniref:DUF6730 family protein n=1 Tax=Zunongwangia sp. HGR-M22 TaxID=3015168 RepID=UPI0022DE7F0A|nr:DUF6730 family protein [Zunongwangia sp. HGR-M22]WBL24515.1 hypothetical protein PBT91_11425 [Zunongwangia sp. HGR-M22]
MARIEDLAALLTEEIDEFKGSVEKLNGMIEKTKTIKLEPDNTKMVEIMQKFSIHLQELTEKQKEVSDKAIEKFENTSFYPAWFTKTLIGLLLSVLLFSGYSIYAISRTNQLEQDAYEKGKSDTSEYFKQFLNDHPESLEDFKKWNTKPLKLNK